MGLRRWWEGVREDLRDWRDERRHATLMAEIAADRQKFPGFDQRERALTEYFRRAPWLTADRELLPTFHGARDVQDRQEQVRLAIEAGQIPLDEKGGLLRNGASYDLNALREERERWAKAFHLEPGELGSREWSQDRTPEDHEERVFGEMFRGSVKAGQTLYGELTPREAADWERLEHLTEQRRAAGWTGENADTPPPGREESAAAYEQLWAAMTAAEQAAKRGVLDTKDPAQRAISEDVLRAVERVEDAEGRGLNVEPTEEQAHRRESAEEIFRHFGFPQVHPELAEAREMDATQERSDTAALLRDHGDEVGPEDAAAFARAYGIDPTEITTAEKVRNMSREELETRAQQLDQGITEAEAAAGTTSDRVGDLSDWAAQARAELAAINERLIADEIEAELAEARAEADTASRHDDPYPTADNFRNMSADELVAQADALEKSITEVGGSGAWAERAQGELLAIHDRLAEAGIEAAVAEAGHDWTFAPPRDTELQWEVASETDRAHVEQAIEDAEDRVRGWAAERGRDAAELTPEEWAQAEAEDGQGEHETQDRGAPDLASQEFTSGLEEAIERGDYPPRDLTVEMEQRYEEQAIHRHEERQERDNEGDPAIVTHHSAERVAATAESDPFEGQRNPFEDLDEETRNALIENMRAEEAEAEHAQAVAAEYALGEYDDPEVEHEEFINPHGVIGGEEAERATEAQAAADVVDREEPRRSHPTVDWTIFDQINEELQQALSHGYDVQRLDEELDAEIKTPGLDQPLVELDQLDGDLATEADSELLVGILSSDDTTAATQIVDDMETDVNRDGADTGADLTDGMLRHNLDEPVHELEDEPSAAVDPSEQLSAEHDDVQRDDEGDADRQPERSAPASLEADPEPSYASQAEVSVVDHAFEAEMDW
jgi:hypothetical protein